MTLEHLRTYFWCFKGVLTFFCCVVHTCKNLCNTFYLQCDDDNADDADDSADDNADDADDSADDSADDADDENEEVCTC